MDGIRGYVRWRGDITLAERPFNAADNLVMAALSYLDLADVVPSPEQGGAVTVREAAAVLAAGGPHLRERDTRRLGVVAPAFLDDLAASARFGDALLSAYVDVVDEGDGAQFAAITVSLADGSDFVAFRGTDFTILGMREDFTMSFELMPSQPRAVAYLRDRMASSDRPVRLGGHSKGGHLAIYAALAVPDAGRDRIVRVYANDAPGFSEDIVAPGASDWLEDRIERILPEFGVVGMLFDRGEPRRVVASSARGLLQHDLMTWEIEGADIVEIPALSRRAGLINAAFDSWLERVGLAERRDFTDTFFRALTEGGARLITEIGSSEYGSYETVLFALRRSSGGVRRSAWLGARAAVRSLREVDFPAMVRERAVVRATATAAAGVYLLVVPTLALEILGSLAALALVALVVARVVTFLRGARRRGTMRWWQPVLAVALVGGTTVAVVALDVLIEPTAVLLGVGLVANAWITGRRAIGMRVRRPRRRASFTMLVASAAVSGLLGVLALSAVDRVEPAFIVWVGQYLLVAGVVELLVVTYDRAVGAYARMDEVWNPPPALVEAPRSGEQAPRRGGDADHH